MKKIRVSYDITHPSFGNFKTLSRTVEVEDDTTLSELDNVAGLIENQIRAEIKITESGRSFEIE